MEDFPTISVVIPALNEEKRIPITLASIKKSAARCNGNVEIIVADNQSTDRTAEVAQLYGAKVTTVTARGISAVRNAGAAIASGEILVFSDADNLLSEDALPSIEECMKEGRFVGGGMGNVRMERLSVGTLLFNMLPLWFCGVVMRMAMVVFFVQAKSFHEIGGFNEDILIAEDYDFGKRLKREGRKHGLKYKNLMHGHVVVSTRKFDEYGDFFIVKHPVKVFRAFHNDQELLDEFWYKPKR